MNKKMVLLVTMGLHFPAIFANSAPAQAAAGQGAVVASPGASLSIPAQAAAGQGAMAVQSMQKGVEDKKPRFFGPITTSPASVAFSPGGTFLAVGSGHDEIHIFEVNKMTGDLRYVLDRNREKLIIKEQGWFRSVAFSPNASWIAGAPSSNSICLFKLGARSIDHSSIYFPKLPEVSQENPKSLSVAFSPNGKFIATANYFSHTVAVCVYNEEQARFILYEQVLAGSHPRSVAYSPNGKWLACASGGNMIMIFAVDENTGHLTIQGSPFTIGNIFRSPNPRSVAYSSNGKWLACANEGDNTVTIFAVDEKTGNLINVQGSPFPVGKSPYSVAFSPNNRWLACANQFDNTVTIFEIDSEAGILKPVQGSPFFIGGTPISVAYSPDGLLLTVALWSGRSISMQEVDQETGAISSVTGDILKVYKDASAETQKILEKQNMPSPVLSVLDEYIVGPKKAAPAAQQGNNDQKDKTEQIKQAIEKTQRQSQSFEKDAAGLFQAIKDGDQKVVQEYATPFTINAPRGDNNRTPLLEAAYLGRRNIIPILLDYKGSARYGVHKEEIVMAKLDAVDNAGNTALILAIVQGDIDSALLIAKKMTPAQRKMSNTREETALMLALRFEKKENISDAAKKKNAELIKLLQE